MRGNVVHKVTLTPHNTALLHHKAALFQYNVRLLADVFLKLTVCHTIAIGLNREAQTRLRSWPLNPVRSGSSPGKGPIINTCKIYLWDVGLSTILLRLKPAPPSLRRRSRVCYMGEVPTKSDFTADNR